MRPVFLSLFAIISSIVLTGCCLSDRSSQATYVDTPAKVKLLASFEDGIANPFNATSNIEIVDSAFASDGAKAIKFKEGSISWNGAQDWSGYDYLKADVYWDSEFPIGFGVEIYDKENAAYFERILYDSVLLPGKNTIKLPIHTQVGGKSRPGPMFKLDAVKRLTFYFTSYNGQPHTGKGDYAYFDNLRLETAADPYRFEELKAFSFGPPTAEVMGGFTPVYADTQYTPERGYGFDFVEGKQILIRGENAFQPDALYQSVILMMDGDFVVDLPNGKYHVFMNIDSPGGYWGQIGTYRNRTVHANGKEVVNEKMDKDKAIAKYYRNAADDDLDTDNTFEKYIDPLFDEKEFEVEVTDGKLRLSFWHDGDHWGIPLSALVIYPADMQKAGKRYLAGIRERRIQDFEDFFKRTLFVDTNPEPELSAEQQKQGFVTFSRDFLTKEIFPGTRPQADELTDKISGFGATGVIEPMSFAIRAYRDFGTVKVIANDLKSDKGVIPASAFKVGYVSNRITRIAWNGNWYTIRPRYVMNENEAVISNHITRWFWITVLVPENTPKGIYSGDFDLIFGNGEKAKMQVAFEVIYDRPLPKLDVPAGPWGLDIGIPWYSNDTQSFSARVIDQGLNLMQKTGFTTFSIGDTGMTLNGKGKELKINFAKLDEQMQKARKHDMQMIVVYGKAIHGVNFYGIGKLTDPKDYGFETEDEFYAHLLGLIDQHSQEKNWLPLVIINCDEPHREADRQANMRINSILNKYVTDRVRFGGAISLILGGKPPGYNHADLAGSMDIATVNLHDLAGVEFMNSNRGWAFYNSGSRWTYGPYMYMLVHRHKMLFRVAWHWYAGSGNPYYGLDAREDDLCWVNANAKGELVTSLNFEKLRLGVTDYRFTMVIAQYAKDNPDTELGKKAQAYLDKVMALIPGEDTYKDRSVEFRNEAIELLKQF